MNLIGRKQLLQFAAILCCGIIPACICQFFSGKPVTKRIHVTSFRYGKDPSVIRCNRGDTLILTFSTNDTGHSFFLEEFDMDVKVSPATELVSVFKTSDPTLEPLLTREVKLIAEHAGIKKFLVSRSNYRCHVWCGPMHAFEQGKLIILPNTLFVFSLGTLAGIIFFWMIGFKKPDGPGEVSGYRELFTRNRKIFKMITSRWPQLILVLLALLMIYLVVLTTLFGTKVSGRNLGVLLMWAVWLFLLVAVMTPFGGRFWCTMCPLPFFGDYLQRKSFLAPLKGKRKQYNNRFSGFFLKWPSFLSNDWLKILLFMVLATFSTLMVAVPRISGIAILLLLVLPTLMSLIWELRSFCRYVCPVSVFINPHARMGMLAIRNKSQAVCNKCTPHFCLNGSTNGWACPYGINVAELKETTDCGLCLECTRSCPYNNVALYLRPLGSELGTRSWSEAWLSLVIFSISIVYSMVYLGHWPWLRDFVNIIDKDNQNLFVIYAAGIWNFSLVLVPGIFYLLSVTGSKLSQSGISPKTAFLSSAGSVLPLSLSVWISFVVAMLFVNVTFIKQSLSDPFGWGWDFLGTANSPWHQFLPRSIPWIQAVLILSGYFLSLRNLKRTWINRLEVKKHIFLLTFPVAILFTMVAVLLLVFFTN